MIGMYLDTIHCDEGTNELTADEPYVLVTVVNLAASVQVGGFPVPLPAFEVVKVGPFPIFTKGKTQPAHFTPNLLPSFWGVNGTPAPLTDPDNAIFVVYSSWKTTMEIPKPCDQSSRGLSGRISSWKSQF